MTDDTLIRDAVTRAVRIQGLVLTAFAIISIVTGVVIGVLVLLLPPKPGDAAGAWVAGVFAVLFVGTGFGVKRWVAGKMGRIRTLFLDSPDRIAEAKVVTIRSHQTSLTAYAVHVRSPDGETLGISVPSAAVGEAIVARLQAYRQPD